MSVHVTITRRIVSEEGTGWDFYCKDCGYHARYMPATQGSPQRLEILNSGDPWVRHQSDPWMEGSLDLSLPPEPPAGDLLSDGPQTLETPSSGDTPELQPLDESWLTPEIVSFIEQITRVLDD